MAIENTVGQKEFKGIKISLENITCFVVFGGLMKTGSGCGKLLINSLFAHAV
jgi:hypothetical protein